MSGKLGAGAIVLILNAVANATFTRAVDVRWFLVFRTYPKGGTLKCWCVRQELLSGLVLAIPECCCFLRHKSEEGIFGPLNNSL